MYKKFFIVFILLSSLTFFDFIFIPSSVTNFLELLLPGVMLFVIILHAIYDKSFRFNRKFRIELGLIAAAVVLSMFGAFYFHSQSFIVTAVTQRFIYFLILYPLLHVLKPKPEELMKIIVVLGLAFAFLYIVQTILYPYVLFNSRISKDRGTLRIFIPGSGYLLLLYLIGLSYFLRTYHFKYLASCVIALVIFALLGTRQVLAPVAIVTLMSILFSKKVKSRAVSILLIILMLWPTYIVFQDVFAALFELSQKEVLGYQENNRFKSAMFFLFEFFPNKLSYIIGNGVPSALSPYGIQVNTFKELFGYYQSDIGIIGDYSRFGILLVIAQISMFVRPLFMRIPINMDFIKLNFVVLLLTMFIGGGAFSNAENIGILCVTLYLIDVCNNQELVDVENKETQS